MEKLWEPTPQRISESNMKRYLEHLEQRYGKRFADYSELYQWSIDDLEQFWKSVAEFCDFQLQSPAKRVFQPAEHFKDAHWFPGAKMNYAENLLRHRDERAALVEYSEDGQRREISYRELAALTAQLQSALRSEGVTAGDRIAGLMPNVIETVAAMLATASLGAVWSSCSPDFGEQGVIDRFGQIEPRLLFTQDGYRYNGKRLDTREKVGNVVQRLPGLARVVVVPTLSRSADVRPDISGIGKAVWWEDFLDETAPAEPEFVPTDFAHPLYILYSSGTTGAPKCIVHGAGGTLIQHLKEHQLHVGLTREDVLFYFTTCGWMMWNWLVSGLATGATLVLFDGSPFAGQGKRLLDMIDAEGITVFGTSAKYIAALEKTGHKPRETHNLDSLKTILSTGSPLMDENFRYVYRDIKEDVCLSSISGGTDIVSCFALGNEYLPVYLGELQCRGLGMAVEIFDESGNSVVEQKGELVCVKPFPCCPVGFWNDPGDKRFLKAYFQRFDNIWAHGDYGKLTERGGMVIYGRADAVLNPGGVRIGTAEIYRQVETLDEVLESVVIGQQWQDDERVVLFVVLREGMALDSDLTAKIKKTIRANASPRHVPAKILQVSDIPRTLNGKIAELAVRDVVHGREVGNREALANPDSLALYRDLPELST